MAVPRGPAGVHNPNPADDAMDDETSNPADDATDNETVSMDDETVNHNADEAADGADDASITADVVKSDETINNNVHLDPTSTLAIPDITLSGPTDAPEPVTITGVAQPAYPPERTESINEGEQGKSAGVEQPGASTGVGTGSVDTTRTQQLHKMQLRHNKRSYEHRFINQHSRAYDKASKEMALAMIEDLESPFGYIFQTEQMSLIQFPPEMDENWLRYELLN